MGLVHWWRRANEASGLRILSVFLVLLALSLLAQYLGLDHLNTIDVTSSLLSLASITLSSVLGGLWSARSWFGPPPEIQARMAHDRLRRDRVGVWWLLGAAWTVTIAAFGAWLTSDILGTCAQCLHGPVESFIGVIGVSRPVSTPRSACLYTLVVRGESAAPSICVATASGYHLPTDTVELNRRVTVEVRKTVLGRVVLSVRILSTS